MRVILHFEKSFLTLHKGGVFCNFQTLRMTPVQLVRISVLVEDCPDPAYHLMIFLFSDTKFSAAWDCSAWVRTYGLFLEERLECFRVLKYDVEAERLSKQGQGPEKV